MYTRVHVYACTYVVAVKLKLGTQTEMGHVCIRYDSEYACKMTVGEWRPKVNIKLIAAAQAQLEKVKGRGVRVW